MEERKLTLRSILATLEFSVQRNLKITSIIYNLFYLFHLQTLVEDVQ